MNTKKNILICPLEWGLGHAARMIPLAKRLMEMDQKVFIASGEEHLLLFRKELPGLTYIQFPGFKPGYSRNLPQYIPLLFKTPLLFFHIIKEHFRLKTLIRQYSIDIVISDNRFGLWNRSIKTVYVTHMPLIPFPKPFRFLEFTGVFLHSCIIRKYTYCFIPDLPGKLNISGRLSHGFKLPGNVRYIGILSRFTLKPGYSNDNQAAAKYNLVILSGPEPQREILKEKVISFLKNEKIKTIILEGHPDKNNDAVPIGNLSFFNHLPAAEMQEMILSSHAIITRAGYTTIMELISLNCSALLIPTPGQTEQEYLSSYLSEKKWFAACLQKNLRKGVSLPPKDPIWPTGIPEQSAILLEEALNELLK